MIVCLLALMAASVIAGPEPVGETATAQGPVEFSQNHAPEDIAFSGKQWALSALDIPQAWDITSGDPGVTIAVLDTGIDTSHPDLKGQVIAEKNFTASDTASDIYGHGTHIAGLIAALNNDKGITGLANGCRLLNVKVADDRGRCFNTDIANGIIWAVDMGADVINMSLYTLSPSDAVEDAIAYARDNGAIVICASGNGTGTKKVYPAVYDTSISVAASDEKGYLAKWSGHGEWVDLAAPGVDIYSTVPGNGYGEKTGTSMACAYVSGVAALLYSVAEDTNDNGYISDEVLSALMNGSDSIGGGTLPIGRVNAYGSITALLDNS